MEQATKGKKVSFKELARSLLTWILKSPFLSLCILLFVGVLIFSLFVAPAMGGAAGTAAGSWQGVTEGIAKGAEEGKNQGISAEDTEVQVETKLEEAGKLQVLLAELKLVDLYTQGEVGNEKYAALIGMNAECVFTVDLTRVRVAYEKAQDKIWITIPRPECSLNIDDSSVGVVEDGGVRAEYKAPLFDGKAEDGYKGWLNASEQIEAKARESIGESSMMQAAENATLRQVAQLAEAICGGRSVTVEFPEGEGRARE